MRWFWRHGSRSGDRHSGSLWRLAELLDHLIPSVHCFERLLLVCCPRKDDVGRICHIMPHIECVVRLAVYFPLRRRRQNLKLRVTCSRRGQTRMSMSAARRLSLNESVSSHLPLLHGWTHEIRRPSMVVFGDVTFFISAEYLLVFM